MSQVYGLTVGVGTPIYWSPEALQWKPSAGPSDVWSLAVVVSEICNNGTKLFSNMNKIAIWKGDCSSLPHNYSVNLKELVTKMLNPDPKKRPSAEAVRTECTDVRCETGFHEGDAGYQA